jgi:hypothetical protein
MMLGANGLKLNLSFGPMILCSYAGLIYNVYYIKTANALFLWM